MQRPEPLSPPPPREKPVAISIVTEPFWPLVNVLASIAQRVEREGACKPPALAPDPASTQADQDDAVEVTPPAVGRPGGS
jgi:hypothetical protein